MSKLSEIQQKIKVGKEHFHLDGKFKFRSLEDILDKLKPIIHPMGFHVTFEDFPVEIAGMAYIGSKAILSDEVDKYEATSAVREDVEVKKMSNPQLSGSAMSYARKYALQGLLALDDGNDADVVSDNTPKEKKLKMIKNSPAWKKAVGYLSEGGDIANIKVKYELTSDMESDLKKEAKV